jgi:ABC-2 type transport system permease protein
VMAASTSAAGLAGAALAVGRRADVLVGNLLAYLIILAGGAFLPPDRLGVARPLAWLLPDAHGVAAARAVVAGGPWAASIALEVLIGTGWLAVAGAVVTIQLRRARRLGQDDFS